VLLSASQDFAGVCGLLAYLAWAVALVWLASIAFGLHLPGR
jgi:hypothetical protein